MVSPAVQGQVRHPSIVPEFLRSTSCKMTSARGHGAIVYCLNSGSEDRQTGHHNGTRRDGRRERGDGRRRREETEKERERVGDGKREEKEAERERSPPCLEKRAESEIGAKKTMNASGVENRID
ncbi:hypothetical protein TNCV_85031 [Trichonephila clavipes]|nr:hypothetical protein TNCV_85031 [Trichonephila clavipes]